MSKSKNNNPNNRVNELKARYGKGYDYKIFELDNMQREFYYEQLRREKEAKKARNG